MPSILVNAHSFYYEEMGQAGEPLVFLSGLGGDHRAFSLAQRYFAAHYRTLAFDARDVGRSDRVAMPYSTAEMADDVAGWLEAIGCRRQPTWSASRWAAWWPRSWPFAIPSVKSLVLASTHAGADEWRRAVIESWVLLRRQVAIGVFTRATLPWLVAPAFYRQTGQIEGLVRFAERNPWPQEPRRLPARRRRRPSTTRGPGRPDPRALPGAGGRARPGQSPARGRRAGGAAARRRMVVLPGVGHMPHIEDKIRFRHEVERFLKQVRHLDVLKSLPVLIARIFLE